MTQEYALTILGLQGDVQAEVIKYAPVKSKKHFIGYQVPRQQVEKLYINQCIKWFS